MTHPHPDKRHVAHMMRVYVLGVKRANGSARALGKYAALVQTYLTAKRELRAGRMEWQGDQS